MLFSHWALLFWWPKNLQKRDEMAAIWSLSLVDPCCYALIMLVTVVATEKALKMGLFFFFMWCVQCIFTCSYFFIDCGHCPPSRDHLAAIMDRKNEHSCGSQPLYVLASCLWAVNSQIFTVFFMWLTSIGPQRKACKKCWGRGGKKGKNTISVFVFSNLSNSQPPFCDFLMRGGGWWWRSGYLQWSLTLNTPMSLWVIVFRPILTELSPLQ